MDVKQSCRIESHIDDIGKGVFSGLNFVDVLDSLDGTNDITL
jgi:hypothetical protein